MNRKLSSIEYKLNYLLEKEACKVKQEDFPRFPKNCESLLKKLLDETTWKRNFMLQTDEGFDINDIIQSGLDNPDHPVGVIAVSKSSYYTFDEILIKAAEIYHNRNLRLNKYQKEDFTSLKTLLLENEDLFSKIIEDIEINTNRNLDGFVFPAKISRSERKNVARNILQVLKMKESTVFSETGKFLSLENSKDLFNPNNQNPFFRSSGFYKDWPEGRFIYINNSETLTLIVNEEDHLKIILKSDFNTKNITNYYNLVEALESQLQLSYSDNLGYLTSLVTNLGTMFLI